MQYIPNKIQPLPELAVSIPLKVDLRPYQSPGVAYGIEKQCFINGDDMGLGKTFMSIATAVALNAFPCLIICPSNVKENWKREWHKFTNKKAIVLEDSIRFKFPEFARVGAAQVFIVNYESLKKYFVESITRPADGKPFKVADIVLKKKFTSIFKSYIVDEIHRVRDFQTQTFKFTMALTKDQPIVMGLTGTMVVNRTHDIAAQLYVINRMGHFGGYKYFKQRFCSGPKGASNLNELNVLLNHICYFRRNKKDPEVKKYLPDKSRQIVMCELSAEARREYDHAVKDLKSYLKDYKSSSDEQIVKSMKGAIMLRIGVLKNISARGKLKDAFEYIADQISQGQKVIVFAVLNDVINKIQERFPNSIRITGSENSLQKQAMIDKFQSDPNMMVAACNIKAAGTGTDGLQNVASTVAFIEMAWNPATMDQAEDRAYRTGQHKNVMCSYFVGRDTIDEWNYQLIETKRELANQVTGADDDVDVNLIDDVVKLFAA